MNALLEQLTNQLTEIENNKRAIEKRVRDVAGARAEAREIAARVARQAGLLTGRIRGLAAATGCLVSEPLPQPADFGEQADAFSLGQAGGRLDGLVAGLRFMEGRARA